MTTTVGKNIKQLRKECAMSQEDLAEILNVTRQAVSNWETGKTQPDIETLTSISEIFDVPITTVIYGYTKQDHESSVDPDIVRKRRIITCVLGLFLLAAIPVYVQLSPIIQQSYYRFDHPSLVYSYMFIMQPLFFALLTAFLLQVLSLLGRFSVKNEKLRLVLLITGILIITYIYLFSIVFFFFGSIDNFLPARIISFAFRSSIWVIISYPVFFMLPAFLIYLGLKKTP